ncbi:UPF0544 protein C5orf45 [Portunus trituberculatus]|uniref:UPF0544 protein C5orf45 n=1 Tax=Portunus trituberculatus TaxID=210409 RepID=A0A5B7H7I7_PORTR|nr:UPF0544 protein C5orf45 [Portunus trituberculatus]
MGQEFNVVRCFSCCVFQSHQVRKDKKFVCKMCGERQSEYGRGSGKDCRVHVQKLNTLRRSMEEGREAELEERLEEGYAAALEGQEEEEEGFPPHTGWQGAEVSYCVLWGLALEVPCMYSFYCVPMARVGAGDGKVQFS